MFTIRNPRRLLSLLILSALAFAQTSSPIPPDVQAAMTELRKERFRAHMAFLADDLLEGRGTGTRGHELAARYTAAQFENLGLSPCGSDGTYYQRVPLLEMSVDAKKSEERRFFRGRSCHIRRLWSEPAGSWLR